MTSEAPISMRDRLREDYRWTDRQRQVLDLMARGRTNTEIADALGLSLAGAKWHVSEILSKLNSDSREEAAEYWRHYNGLAPRFARVFRGLFVSSGLRWAAGIAGVAVAVAAGAVLVLALGGDDDQQATPATATSTVAPTATLTSTATPRPTPPPTTTPTLLTYPADTRTNIPEVDAVIEAVLAGDVAALKSLMKYTLVACKPIAVPEAPPCRPEEPEGTLVEAFVTAICEGGYVRRDHLDQTLTDFVDGRPPLYAVYRVKESAGIAPELGDYGVVFLAPDNRGRTVRVDNDGMVGFFLDATSTRLKRSSNRTTWSFRRSSEP